MAPSISDLVSASIVPVFGTFFWFGRTMWFEEERFPYMSWYLNADPSQNVAYLSNDTHIPCASLELLYARGATEPSPLGYLLGPKLKRAVTGELGDDVVVVGLSYPATMESTTPAAGVQELAGHVKLRAQQCPDTAFALAGYALGADVLHAALDQLADVGDRIRAITVFGDPYASIGFPPYYAGRTLSLCNPGDRACGGAGLLKHLHYGANDTELPQIAAKFVAQKARAAPLAGSGAARMEKLPPAGAGAWVLAPWKPWPPLDWKELYKGGVVAPTVGLTGVNVTHVRLDEL